MNRWKARFRDATGQVTFIAVSDQSQHLPPMIVSQLVGLPDFDKENTLKWAAAAFDVLGVRNERGTQPVAAKKKMRALISSQVNPDTPKPGNWTYCILDLLDPGKLDVDLAPFALRDDIDPTISLTVQPISQLSQNPADWDRLRDNPDLCRSAVHEALRQGCGARAGRGRYLGADADLDARRPLPKASPGAHIDGHIRDGLVRQYSLINDTAAAYRIAVHKEPKSRGGSIAMHARFAPGRAMAISSPRNNFPQEKAAAQSILFGGGIGMTPVLAMAWALHRQGKPFECHFSARSRDRAPFGGGLNSLPFADRIGIYLDNQAAPRLDVSAMLRTAMPGCAACSGWRALNAPWSNMAPPLQAASPWDRRVTVTSTPCCALAPPRYLRRAAPPNTRRPPASRPPS
ncbi:hypothetical protein KO516_11235 [Citreicella sp. C3M06]|uniref:ferredoxin reductase n=1 Tax=Citreicella sp. C3M06 TaxID=2841564 RepID=UPI001C09DD33|nr:ferredoxin reductase [Citreicella sp. C3M06]MBU2961382.1 hypothetical protein [Citreicella sp. C3M06]